MPQKTNPKKESEHESALWALADRLRASAQRMTLDILIQAARVEVSKVGGKELFSWPGASHFEDKGLKAFLAIGATTTGMFGLAAHELFISGSAELKYHGEETLASHRAVRYDFHLPQDHGYEVRMGDAGQTLLGGSFGRVGWLALGTLHR
jgi:hypothetical protein